jgi:hypothetical protein
MYSKVIILEKTGNSATAALVKFAIDKDSNELFGSRVTGTLVVARGGRYLVVDKVDPRHMCR